MLGSQVMGYIRACTSFLGGCDLLYVGDANDFDFTEGAADANGNPTGYTTLARRLGPGSGAVAYAGLQAEGAVIVSGGTGYSTAPTVTIAAPSGVGTTATATATVSGGVVTAITITSPGSGYGNFPAISFSGGGGTGATASLTMKVGSIIVNSGGTGYTSATTPSVVISGGNPSTPATANNAVVTNGVVQSISVNTQGSGYTSAPTVTVVAGGGATAAGGAYLFPIDSLDDSIGVEVSQANAEGSSSSYEYSIQAKLAKMSQQLTNFNKKIDAASSCGQLVFIWRNNDGKIFVAGEKYVGGLRLLKFKLRQDGSKQQTGKKFSEFNGQDLVIKGTYSRSPYEFTGGIGVIDGLTPPIA